MRTNSRCVTAAVILALASAAGVVDVLPAYGQAMATEAATDGKAIIEQALEAVNKAQAVSFSAKLLAEGNMLSRAYPSSEGEVKALRSSEATNAWLVRVTSSSAEPKVDVAWGADSLEGVDHAKKIVSERAGHNTPVTGMRLAQVLRLKEVLSPQPFKDALGASEYTVEDSVTLDGEVCDVVMVAASGTSKKTRWAIARKDRFPRMIEQLYESASMQGKLTLTFTNVSMDSNTPPAMAASELRVSVPEGYTEDRQISRPTVRPVPGKQQPTPASSPALSPAPDSAPTLTPAPDPTPDAQPATPKGPQAAADFELSTPNAEKVSLSEFKGKVVVMQFWGSWCLPCRDWHTTLSGVVKTGAGEKATEVVMLALAVRERDVQNAVEELAARNASSDFKLLVQADQVAKEYNVSVYPTTVVVDKDGLVVASVTDLSAEGATSVESAIKAALGIVAATDTSVAIK